jgi:hypothetical protein
VCALIILLQDMASCRRGARGWRARSPLKTGISRAKRIEKGGHPIPDGRLPNSIVKAVHRL